MSDKAQIFNPTETTLEASGDGFYICRMPTNQRLSLVLGVKHRGLIVYDDTLRNYYQWNGTQWLAFSAGTSGAGIYSGTGNPNGVVTAGQGSLYFDFADPSTPTQYLKTTVSGNTGWI
jgi:hypothetical protein